MERIGKKACELFVPMVKDGRDCSVCGFSLLQHSFILPKQNIHQTDLGEQTQSKCDSIQVFNNNSVDKNYSPDLYYNNTFTSQDNHISIQNKMKNDLTPSSNSAFSQYRRLPLLSTTKKSSTSSSNLKSPPSPSPYKVPEAIISVGNTEILKPKAIHQRKSYAYGETVPPCLNFNSPNTISNYSSSPQSNYTRGTSSPTSGNRENNKDNNIPRSKNFRDILSRFQNASENFSRQYSLRYPTSAPPLNNINVSIPNTNITSGSNTISGRRPRNARRTTLGITQNPFISNSTSKLQHYYQPSLIIESEGKGQILDDEDEDIVSISEDNKTTLTNYNNNIHRHKELDTFYNKEEQQNQRNNSTYLRTGTPSQDGNNEMKLSPSPSQRISSRPASTSRFGSYSINGNNNNGYNSGSDSGCVRENSSSACVSPRSPDCKIIEVSSKNIFNEKQAYNTMTANQATTLAMVAENFNEISSNCYPEQRIISKDYLNRIAFYQINFKYSSPVIIKGSIIISDAEISTGYGQGDVRVSVMISPAAHYSPLMGRQAQISGFGPVILSEFEEPSSNMTNFLTSCGIYVKSFTNYKITIMPAQICCSFHTLAAQFLHHSSKSINPNKYEEHVCFIMLQLLTALKFLQSDGVERLSTNFKEFLITYHHSDLQTCLQNFDHLPRLFLLKEAIDVNEDDNQSVGMCKYAMRALYTLLNHKMHTVIPEIVERSEFSFPLKRCAELLSLDKSSSLSEAKNVLELAFFVGPTRFVQENEAKIWLDINRANLLNRILGIMLTKKETFLDLKEKMHIQFLLSSTPRSLCQSLKLLSKGSLRNISTIQDSEC
uniref:Protein kinase domain-containing protein n=1 Tax=Parastrongyloides trichosuri TaxID=131310 RepID=A0A0N4ZXI6_PARTI